MTDTNTNKIIFDLCGGTGNWSKPYADAGYDVRVITLPDYDVRQWFYNWHLTEIERLPIEIYGVLAAPPCTHFSLSGAQYWKQKDADGRTFEDVSVLTACLMIIARVQPKFWAIENPVGRMKTLLGNPDLVFNPCDYGDPYRKKTYLWGNFKAPEQNPVEPEYMIAKNGDRYSKVHWSTGGTSAKTKEKRSATPPGFAQAFYKANL